MVPFFRNSASSKFSDLLVFTFDKNHLGFAEKVLGTKLLYGFHVAFAMAIVSQKLFKSDIKLVLSNKTSFFKISFFLRTTCKVKDKFKSIEDSLFRLKTTACHKPL